MKAVDEANTQLSATPLAKEGHQTPAIEPLLLQRTPLMTPQWLKTLRALQEHPDAPRFNHGAGDRLTATDVEALHTFRHGLELSRHHFSALAPDASLLERVETWRQNVPRFQETVPHWVRLPDDWQLIPTTTREDLARHPEKLMPLDVSTEQLLVYRTAGTTGHALLVPHHARAAATYQPLIEVALARYGVRLEGGSDKLVCCLMGAQAQTVTYPCNLSYFQGAGFAKLNLTPSDWPSNGAAQRYLSHFSPQLLTGDPITFSEMMRLNINLTPRALLTTAVAMSPRLKSLLQQHFQSPVIDWYSLTETGPLGYACSLGYGYHQLSTDVFLEALGPDGQPVEAGQRGEITVTGGRNPFLPLLRYRTGDWGRIDTAPCPCGDPMPRLLELEGRVPVLLRGHDGRPINPVDISRELRRFPLVQHELVQDASRRVSLVVRPVASGERVRAEELRAALQQLFGPGIPIEVSLDETFGDRSSGGKVLPYRSELLEE